jgi:hypothetical protein
VVIFYGLHLFYVGFNIYSLFSAFTFHIKIQFPGDSSFGRRISEC